MNVYAIILIIFIISIFKVLSTDQIKQEGGVKPPENTPNLYLRQFNELDNVDNVLLREQKPGNTFIDTMVAKNMYDFLPKLDYNFSDIDKDKGKDNQPDNINTLVEDRQPYFLDEPLIIDNYGHKFYWDWRYPKNPISIDFLIDEKKYIKEHPNVYPSYVIKSRSWA